SRHGPAVRILHVEDVDAKHSAALVVALSGGNRRRASSPNPSSGSRRPWPRFLPSSPSGQKHADIIAGRQYRRLELGAGDAHTEILPLLRHGSVPPVPTDDPVGVSLDLPANALGPALEDDHLVELLSFGLVHVHHYDARFRLVRRC